MLHINDLTYEIGDRVLYEHATMAITARQRVGLVGANGAGKSTLFRLIQNPWMAPPQTINPGPRVDIVAMAQEPPDGPQSLLETVLAADTERASLLDEAEHATDPHRLGDIHTRLDDIDAHAAPARAATILAGLGFDHAAQQRPCSTFSGGWRMRVALAAVLFARADLMLLDEPSNYLDLEARLWLETYLARYDGTLLLISHDRQLLNAVCTHIVHIQQRQLVSYRGNYDTFDRTRRSREAHAAALFARQQRERARIQSFIDRFRAKATKARQAQSRIKALERMETIAPIGDDRATRFDFPPVDQLPPPVIGVENVAVGYDPDKPILSRLNLRIDMDDRIGLVGANGNGKTTLIRLLSGRLEPQSGHVSKSRKLKIGYFSQAQSDEMDLDRTAMDHMRAALRDANDQACRSHLARFGIDTEKADLRVGLLSGGEKARLLFALMTRSAPHLMLLDEPTNHLDMDAREALISALAEYEGAVILVSHDPALLNRSVDRLWHVADGTCKPLDGDLDTYTEGLLQRTGRTARSGGGSDASGEGNKKEQRRAAAAVRQSVAHLKRDVRDSERQMADLNARKAKLEAKLADPKLYDGPADAVTALQIELADIARQLETAEESWLEAQEAFEAAMAEAET